jgi:hypothetical protein
MKPKPVKAWAVIDKKNGQFLFRVGDGVATIFDTLTEAEAAMETIHHINRCIAHSVNLGIVEVEIRPVKKTKGA